MPETNNTLPHAEQLLIKGCMAGDRASQQRLYNLFAPKMMGVCLWYARNRQEAEEILQDGFMRVFTYIHKYTGAGPLEGWIRKIMVNAALFKFRSKWHLRPVVELHTDLHDADEGASVIELLDAKDLMLLVQSLSPGYRMVFNLYVLEGMKHREIAAELGISEGTSKSNLADARTILQKYLTAKKKAAAL
jgi:RNA polymerase sigma factor (sigma-70 family)